MSLEKVRGLMKEVGVDCWLVPSDDPHSSEYVAPCFRRREYISGFSGSAGIAVITQESAFLWTDGRYFIQAEKQLSAAWTLKRLGIDPNISSWINSQPAGYRVGVDPSVTSLSFSFKIGPHIEVVHVVDNLVDRVWEGRPATPSTAIFLRKSEYTGESSKDRINRVLDVLDPSNESRKSIFVSALDEVCWLTHLRGTDVPYNPVFLAFMYISREQFILFTHEAKLSTEAVAHLKDTGISVRAYEDAYSFLENRGDVCLSVNPNVNLQAWAACKAFAMTEPSPVEALKACKNEVEVDGMRKCQIRDGVAIIKMFSKLQSLPKDQLKDWTEVTAGAYLDKRRTENDLFMDLSFETICGCGPNGAIIHYRAEEDDTAPLSESMLLVDSGGQYWDGTTDTTRTTHLGTPSEKERLMYTLVLKGHLDISRTVFPSGTTGQQIDCLARIHLWRYGLEYMHGTGHGVGSYLNVHEGPHGITYSAQCGAAKVPLTEGMVISNEPGVYLEGEFGVRIENMVVVKKAETQYKIGNKEFFELETITMVPYERSLIDLDLLTPEEISWINTYHQKVLKEVGPLLAGDEAYDYLKGLCDPL